MGRWFDPRDGQVKWAPDPPEEPPRPRWDATGRDRDTTTLSPVPEWDYPDHSHRLSFHEAAHCVALYLFDRPIKDAKVRRTRGRTTAADSTDDAFAGAVCFLAGEAFERSIGLAHAGGRSDLDKAEMLLKMHVSPGALDEACRVVEETALALAATERFHALTFALAPVLHLRENLGGAEIRRILEEADPERLTERHSSVGSERHSAGPRVAFIRHHRPPDHNPDCIVCRQYPGWWDDVRG